MSLRENLSVFSSVKFQLVNCIRNLLTSELHFLCKTFDWHLHFCSIIIKLIQTGIKFDWNYIKILLHLYEIWRFKKNAIHLQKFWLVFWSTISLSHYTRWPVFSDPIRTVALKNIIYFQFLYCQSFLISFV